MYHAFAVALAIAAAPAAGADAPAQAHKDPLQLRPKSGVVALTPSHDHAPFVSPLGSVEPELIPRHDQRLEQSRSSCKGNSSLCYDQETGRIVYKPARNFMPDIPGLTPDNISVKRDRIVFRYTF
jgi:hypothetical protein